MTKRKNLLLVPAISIGSAVTGCVGKPFDALLNATYNDDNAPDPNEAEELFHKGLFVVDLHARGHSIWVS